MKETGFVTLDTGALGWKASRHEGVRYKALRYDSETGAGALMLEMAAGVSYPAHLHTEGEDVLVLEGELIIGSRRHRSGSYVYSPPGSVHAPRTETGCLMFIVMPGRVEETGG